MSKEEFEAILSKLGFSIFERNNIATLYHYRRQSPTDIRVYKVINRPEPHDYSLAFNDAANYIFQTGTIVENERIVKYITLR